MTNYKSKLTDHLCECGCGGRTKSMVGTDRKRGHIRGEPFRFIQGHHVKGVSQTPDVVAKRADKLRGRRFKQTVKGYRAMPMFNKVRPQYVHRARAERALGKPLPPKAVVHHADGTKAEDAPLVICEDNAYHRLLHARLRVKVAGGNPNTDKVCSDCQAVKPFAAFNRHANSYMGLSTICRDCECAALRDRRLRIGATRWSRGPNSKTMATGRW